jgi:hypothetical protein
LNHTALQNNDRHGRHGSVVGDQDRAPLGGQLWASMLNCLEYGHVPRLLPCGGEDMRPRPAMKLVSPLAARSPGFRLALAREIERHCSADEILQCRLIDLLAFADVNGAPDISFQAGVE